MFYRKAQDTKFTLTSSIGTYLYSASRFLWKDELKKRNRNDKMELCNKGEELNLFKEFEALVNGLEKYVIRPDILF